MIAYRHTQVANWIWSLLGGVAVVLFVVGMSDWRPMRYAAVALCPLLVLGGWMFRSLTIEIVDGELHWRFGPGWIHKRVPLAEIASARVVRTSVIEGWGIHYSRFGWLYNISGLNAVAITLRNGKRFCLGTDQPEALLAQLSTPPVIAA